ncbi:unnamed protein product [Rotaria sp. Silwood1]|nr:unnamed protein product [Rotaria sp. Silwood1]
MHWLLVVGWFLLINQSIGCTVPSFSSLQVQPHFNLHRFLGIWFEIKWFTTQTINPTGVWSDYSLSFQLQGRPRQRLLVYGRARRVNASQCHSFGPWLMQTPGGARLFLQKDNLTSNTILHQPFYVLKTDYRNYALVYQCLTPNYRLNQPCTSRILYIFSRRRFLPWRFLQPLYRYIANVLCIYPRQLRTTSHTVSCYGRIMG